MQLKLKSDFWDFYDMAFDGEGFEFRRLTTDGPNRVEMFNWMRRLELKTPFFGKPANFIVAKYRLDTSVVCYLDIYSHAGEGKILIPLKEAKEKYSFCYCSQYIKPDLIDTPLSDYKGKSNRLLFIGNRCFTMDYVSKEDWRSNVGEGDIINCKEILSPSWRSKVHYPLFAIDFVGEYEKYAIDFNIAPCIRGTGVNYLISSSEILLAYRNWFRGYFNA